MKELFIKITTIAIALISKAKCLKISKSYFVDGMIMDAVVVNGYVVSEYVGFLKFALLAEEEGQNIHMYDHYLGDDKLQIYALAPSETHKAVLVAGSSHIVKAFKLAPQEEGTFLRQWELPNQSFYPMVLVMRKIPNTEGVLASCDNVTMSVLDLANNNTFLKPNHTHHLDLIKELEIGGNRYMASGVQRYLVLNDWTDGTHLRLFTTRNLDNEGGMHRINGLAHIDLENGRDWYAIGADNSRIYIYDTEKELVLERFDEDNELLIDLIHLDQTEYLLVNAYDKILIHHIFSSKSKTVYSDIPPLTGRIFQVESQVLLTGEYGVLAILDLEGDYCNYACETCSKSISSQNCLTCSEGFTLEGSTCKPKCNANQLWTGTACQNSCVSDLFRKNKYECGECNSECETCLMNSAESCLTCPAGKLRSVNGTCVNECGFGAVQIDQKNCKACPPNCKLCSALSIGLCTECKNSSYQLSASTKQCFDTCEIGEYLDERTNECHYCGFGCLNCYGFHPGQCFACVPGFKTYNNTCFSQCPEGTFEIPRENTCQKCDSNCAICHNMDECMECAKGYILDVETNTCLANCTQKGKYFLPPSYCEFCPHGCESCSLEGCITCLEGYTLNGYYCEDASIAPRFSNFLMLVVILLGSFGTGLVYYCMKKKITERKLYLKSVYDKVKAEIESGEFRQAGALAQNELNDAGDNQMSEVSYQEEGDDDFNDVFGDGGQDSQIRSKNNPYGNQ